MRHDTANTIRRAAMPVTSFHCENCGAIEHSMNGELPMGWETENWGDIVIACCASCAPQTPDFVEP